MEESLWGKWFSDVEMEDHVNECLCHTNTFDEEFLRDILQQPQLLEATAAPVATPVLAVAGGQTSLGRPAGSNPPPMIKNSSSQGSKPTTYILSFDKSAALSVHDPWKEVSQSQLATDSLVMSSLRPNQNQNQNQNQSQNHNQGTKKTRSASETLDHIMSERNRRQELTKKFIALSATIPGLKKMDKAHVLQEAINYVKQLQERVKELEEDIEKNGGELVITITRSHLCTDDGTAFCETNSNTDECCGPNNETLPEVEAKVLGKEVLIKIHCPKQTGILLKILSQLERLHLSISSSNVLPFGNTLDITIIAQMGTDKYSLIVKDLVKNLRQVAMSSTCDV